MTTFKLLVGLPGSGKTHFGKDLGLPFIDDMTQTGGIHALSTVAPEDTWVISDFGFVFEDVRKDAVAALTMRFPGCRIEWIVWENNLAQCWRNIQQRADGRAIQYESLRHTSKEYTYPDNSEIRPVYSPSNE